MAALARNWIAGGAVAVAVTLAVASLVLRETSRARLSETPAPPATLAALERKPPTPTSAPAPGPAPTELAFDVARIEPGGAAVVAGHGPPRTQVQLLDGERVLDAVRSDDAGQFVFMPPPLPAGSHVLRLKAAGAQGKTVRVEVPGLVAGQPAPANPSAPSPTIAETPPGAGARDTTPTVGTLAPAGPGDIPALETVPSGAVPATTVADAIPGSYPPGPATNPAGFAPVRRAAAARSAATPPPSPRPLRLLARVRVVAPVVPRLPLGRYPIATVRFGYAWTPPRSAAVGQLRRAGSRSFTSGRASIRYGAWRAAPMGPLPPFVRGPPPTASSPPFVRTNGRIFPGQWQAVVWPPQGPRAAPARYPAPVRVVVPGVRVVVVQPGDTLWRISQRAYGSGFAFVRVVQANGAGVRDPKVILAGQRLILPGVPGKRP